MRVTTRFRGDFVVSPAGTTVAKVLVTMMKLFTVSAIAFVALSSVVGCSSTDKGGVAASSSEALASIQTPTGTFDKTNGSQAFAGYQKNKQSSSGVASTGGASSAGGTTAQSIKFLANQTGNCSQNQACACPGGGTVTAAATRTNDRVELSLDMSACVFENGNAFDGRALLVQSQKPLIDDSKLPKTAISSSADGEANLLAMEGDATVGKQKEHVKLVYLEQHGWQYLSVDVPSGSLVIGLGADGTAIVKAKDKTWTCESSSKGYSCKSDGSADDAIEVDSSASASTSTGSTAANTSDDSASDDAFGSDQ